jgi:thymidylate synthase ThyX
MDMIKAEVLRHPTELDWTRCRLLAATTEGYHVVSGPPDDAWKVQMLKCRHSPIRTLVWTVRLEVPYWVSVHLVRHKHGVEHYVSSQRNDRQNDYDRAAARQDAPVTHVMDINAEALMRMAGARLCSKASLETRQAMLAVCEACVKVNPELAPFLVPACWQSGGYCRERKPCGFYQQYRSDR